MKWLTATLALAMLGCGGDGTVDVQQDQPVPGVYDLVTVNNAPLPYLVNATATQRDSLRAEVLTLTTDGKVSRTSELSTTFTPGGTTFTSQSSSGTYLVSGSTITTTDTFRGAFNGTVSGGILRLTKTVIYQYTRRP